MNIFNLSTKKNSNAKGIEENVHYKIVKDGHGIEHKVLNFENEEICPRFGIIQLEPMKTSRRHLNNASFKVILDRELGVLVGIPSGIDYKTKQIMWKKIIVEENETLDLSIPDQAMMWACIRRGPYFTDFRNGKEQNPNLQVSSKTKYKAIDKEREAETFLLNRRTKKKATEIAEELVGEELREYGMNFGFDVNLLSPTSLSVEVIKYAESEPEKFMAIHNSDTRVELTVLNKAKSMGVVVESYDNGTTYGGVTLGFNQSEVLKYLKDHPATVTSIDALCRQNEREGDIAMDVKKVPLEADDANAEIARLRRELALKEKALRNATDIAVELRANTDLNSIDPEFAELMKEAKRYDVKGAHNIKDKEKLRAKIEEKKAQAKN